LPLQLQRYKEQMADMEKAWEKRLAEARKENEVLLANAYPSSVMHGHRHLLSCVLTCVLIFFVSVIVHLKLKQLIISMV